jgi:hypothetical protein
MFVNPSIGNLRLNETATAAIGKGVPLSEVRDDIDGNLRNSVVPCIGAFEVANGSVEVTGYTAVANGTATLTSTKITLTFDAPLESDLAASDITFDGGSTGALMGTLTKISGTVYELAISDVMTSGDVKLSIGKTNVDSTNKILPVYYAAPQPVTDEEKFSPDCDIITAKLGGADLKIQDQNYKEGVATTNNRPDGNLIADVKNLTITGKANIGDPISLDLTVSNTAATYEFYTDRECSIPIASGAALKAGENLIYIKVKNPATGYYQVYTVSIMGLGDPKADALYNAYAEPTYVVSDLNSLREAIIDSKPGDVIGIAGGDYYLFADKYNRRLHFDSSKNNVILRSVSGNYEDVTLHGSGFHKEGGYWAAVPHDEMVIMDGATDITLYGFTIRDVNANGFKLEGRETNITIDRCRAIDVNEKAVKGSGQDGGQVLTNLVIKNCWFENTQLPYGGYLQDHEVRPGNYIASIDCMNVRGALIQNNTFKNIQGSDHPDNGQDPFDGG